MNLLDKRRGALLIIHAKGLAIVVAEIKLVYIALQMLLAHALVNASKAALEDREVAFNVCSSSRCRERIHGYYALRFHAQQTRG